MCVCVYVCTCVCVYVCINLCCPVRSNFGSAHIGPMQSKEIFVCLKLQPLQDGELCSWNPGESRRTKGLQDYLVKSGWWLPLKKLMSVDQSLLFEQRDVETAVEMYFKDKQEKRSQSQICAEAKKIVQLLSGFRRILRLKYDVDKTLMNFMELNEDHGTEAHPFLAKFGMLRDVESDESLVSMPSEAESATTLERGPVPLTRRRQCNQERGNAAKHQKLHDNEDESAEDESSVDTKGEHKESESESPWSSGKEDYPEFVIMQDWAVRFEDDLPAESVTQAKDGKAVFHWVDGDIYYSQEVLYTEAIASRQARTLSNKHRDTIQEARKACEHHGDFKVSVLPRPKLSNGGWEVVLKTNKNKQQIWSMTSSHSKPVADSLLGTIKWANRLAHSKCVKAKEEEVHDESKGTPEKIGKPNKGKKSSPPEKKVDKYKKDEVTQDTVTEGGSMSHEQLTEKTSAKEAKTKRKKRKKTKLG